MDFITATVLSGVTYDLLKHGAQISATSLKDKLRNWLLSDTQLATLADEISSLEINDEMSEKVIQKKLEQSELIKIILNSSKNSPKEGVALQHFGTGDNVAGNKIVQG